MSQMTVTPLSDALGAEINGIDAGDLDDASFGRLRDALHDNIMLAVRDQALTPAAQTDFARRFGEIQYHINSEYKMEDQPEVLILSTEIVAAGPFYFAEDYHQQYLAKNPGGYCGLGGTGISCPVGAGVAAEA